MIAVHHTESENASQKKIFQYKKYEKESSNVNVKAMKSSTKVKMSLSLVGLLLFTFIYRTILLLITNKYGFIYLLL